MDALRRLTPLMRSFSFTCLLFATSSCASLYRVQLGDVEAAAKGRAVSIKVSETTVDLRELGAISGALGRHSGSRRLSGASNALDTYTKLFQFGPVTGTPVYNEFYARDIPERLAASCTSGRLANVVSVRESRDYPVVKGQIVRIDALCMQP